MEDGLFSAEILADSIYKDGTRLTTMVITLPRDILAELNTWRMRSSSSASSRARPASKIKQQLMENPYIPEAGKNQSGMQQAELLNEEEMEQFVKYWLGIRDDMVAHVDFLSDKNGLNIHKQVVNRLTEAFQFCTVVVTATDWDNMFAQRTHHAAAPGYQKIAKLMYKARKASTPRFVYRRNELANPMFRLASGGWTLNAYLCNHLPFWMNDHFEETLNQLNELTALKVQVYLEDYDRNKGTKLASKYSDFDFSQWLIRDIAAGRAAKVSYDNLETGKIDVLNDIRLAVQLRTSYPGHYTPFEHIATPADPSDMTYRISQLQPVVVAQDHNMVGKLTTTVGIEPKPGEIGYCANLKGWRSMRKEFYNETIYDFEMED